VRSRKKLLIQIPAYNEEEHIEDAIRDLPSSVDGFDSVHVVVINDGSTDGTVDIVKGLGVECLDMARHYGMGMAFRKGLEYGISNGCDVIVNTDADLQYQGADIFKITSPILNGTADIVIADRQLEKVEGYPPLKLISQKAGSLSASLLLRSSVKDVTSGFRAYSKDCAISLAGQVRNVYDYAVESLCISSRNNMRTRFVPVNIRYPTRKSRLINSKIYYTRNFLSTLLRYALPGYLCGYRE